MISRSRDAQVSVKADLLARNESPTISTVSTDTEFSVAPRVSAEACPGILKASCERTNSIRIDRGGNVIVAGSKSHRICFADEVEGSPRSIVRVHPVESFKSWNFGNSFVRGENSCVCTIS